jgi:hypothetical protein
MDKQELVTALRDVLQRWETLLATLNEEQITAPQLPGGLSIKDVIAHLRVWQQRSIARLEAAQTGREPDLAGWPAGLDPESDEHLDQINAWIYETNRDQPWSSVYRDWRDGFLRFLDLADDTPERDLFEARYPWLEGYPLAAVLQGSYDHHHEEHLEPLLQWLRQRPGETTDEHR